MITDPDSDHAEADALPHGRAERATLFRELLAIGKASAAQLRERDVMTEADLYDEDGLPA